MLLIPMDMPKNCDECPFLYESRGYMECKLTEQVTDFRQATTERLQDCPLVEAPKWIPVTERLPEHSGDYLVYSVGGNWKQLACIEIAFWDDKRFITNSLFEPTHWMPLPQPPKDGET